MGLTLPLFICLALHTLIIYLSIGPQHHRRDKDIVAGTS